MRRTISLLAIVVVALFIPASSFGQDLSKDFVRTGVHESLIDSWRVSNGVTTAQTFASLIEVIVSGFGINVPPILEDAFYPINSANPDLPIQGPGVLPPNGLHISFTGCSLSSECGAPRIESLLIYVDGIGFVTPPATTIDAFLRTIPYSPQHVYRFVIDIGTIPQTLTLGHGDGGISDNEGFFAIQLFEVVKAKGKRK